MPMHMDRRVFCSVLWAFTNCLGEVADRLVTTMAVESSIRSLLALRLGRFLLSRRETFGHAPQFESERVIGLEEGLFRDNLKHSQTGLAAEPFWIPTACGVPRGAEVRTF